MISVINSRHSGTKNIHNILNVKYDSRTLLNVLSKPYFKHNYLNVLDWPVILKVKNQK